MSQTFPWEQVSELLDSVMELPAPERVQFLEGACADEPLRRYVASMILSYQETAEFLETPPVVEASSAAPTPWFGRRIGCYVLIEELGEGGMGVVYRAIRADDHYLKSVAIKVMKGDFSSSFSIMRFRAERQILAGLEHPHIARMLDGGSTEEGTPYLVMELIEGSPLDEYCDAHKLSVHERLRLFRQACAAVQYAHQHLVIHRDLKPKNILVTKNGEVKLLDFGIAKILDPESFPQVVEPTSPLMRMLSPEYASPEQVTGNTVTTASDIYSLGIVLYLLLTGQRPYSIGAGSFAELNRAICDTEAVRPSEVVRRVVHVPNADGQSTTMTPESVSAARCTTPKKLIQRLQGDLDNIVLKALRKEPERRYETVEQLSEDLRRHLEGLPVKARPDTLRYRAQKLVHRHRTLVTTIGVAVMMVVVAFVLMLRETRIALEQRAAAERRLHAIRGLAQTNLVEVHSAMEHLPGAASARNLAVQRSLQYLDQLNAEVQNDAQLTRQVADAYEKIGDLQGAYSGQGIGDSKAAQVSFAKALELRSKVLQLPGSTDEDSVKKLDVLRKYTRCLMLNGDTGAAYGTAQAGLASATEYAGKHPENPASTAALASAHYWVAVVSGGVGSSGSTRQIDDAIDHDRKHTALFEGLASSGTVPQNLIWRSQLLLALHLSKARKFEESQQILEHAVATVHAGHDASLSGLSDVYNILGLICERQGRQRDALAWYKKAWPLAKAAAAADPQDLDAQLGLQIAEGHLGMQAVRLEGQRGGLVRINQAVEHVESLLQADPGHTFYMALLVVGYAYQGEVMSSLGDQNRALEKYRKALETAELISQHDPADLESRISIAKVHSALGIVQGRSFRYTEARRELAAAKSAFDGLLQLRPGDAEAAFYSAQAEAYSKVLAGCRDRLACNSSQRMQLPSLLN